MTSSTLRRALVTFAVATSMVAPLTAAAAQTKGAAPAKKAAAPNHARTIELIGSNGKHRTLTAADLAKLPHVEATVSAHGVTGKYRGVPLGDLLTLAGRPVGEALRGKALATVVSVEAADNYRVVFALAEVDSGFTNKVIFLADSKDGQAIDPLEGPFRIIVPDEKRPARWAKQVVRIRLVDVK